MCVLQKEVDRLQSCRRLRRELTTCCEQAASKGHAGELGACLRKRSQAPDSIPAARSVIVGVHHEGREAACSRRNTGLWDLQHQRCILVRLMCDRMRRPLSRATSGNISLLKPISGFLEVWCVQFNFNYLCKYLSACG